MLAVLSRYDQLNALTLFHSDNVRGEIVFHRRQIKLTLAMMGAGAFRRPGAVNGTPGV